MKKIRTLILAAGLLLLTTTGAAAIDFNAKGQWLMGFGIADDNLIHKARKGDVSGKNGPEDQVDARQRVRLQLDAIASGSLSGTIIFEIGDQIWGQTATGGALGADGTVVEVQQAYIDWAVPDTSLKLRMGIQFLMLPNKAGGTSVFLTEGVPAITAAWQYDENFGLTAFWARPANDNFTPLSGNTNGSNKPSYLDNIDLFALTLPVHLDGLEMTPWIMYGIQGKNALKGYKDDPSAGWSNAWFTHDGNMNFTLWPYYGDQYNKNEPYGIDNTSKAYGSMFWAGLPLAITAWDPWNIEFEFNYGFVEGMGHYDAYKGAREPGNLRRGNTQRQGWLAKALIEYKTDWGIPGIFGWYASGDDGSIDNGSERMPSVQPAATFTSFMGAGNYDWMWVEYGLNYAGTWGIGAQLRDMNFIEDLRHTLRVAYWGGTNSPSMAKYMDGSYSWCYGYSRNSGWGRGPYLTTNDGLLEINWINAYKMYENFEIDLELGYIANFVDHSTWKKAGNANTSFQKQDAWKAQLIFAYSF